MADCVGSIFTYNNRIDYQQKTLFQLCRAFSQLALACNPQKIYLYYRGPYPLAGSVKLDLL